MKNKILTIAHTKGGVGKSTILVNTVIALLSLGYKIRVADCDPNKVSTFISKRRAKNKKLKNYTATVISSVTQLDEFCSQPFDGITVIDTAGVDCALTRRAIEHGTLTVVPVAPVTTELIGFATFKAVINKIDVNTSSVKVVLNQVHSRAVDFEYFKGVASSPFDYFTTTIPRLKDFDTALASGLGVTEFKKIKDKQTTKYKEITSSVRVKALVNEIIEMMEV